MCERASATVAIECEGVTPLLTRAECEHILLQADVGEAAALQHIELKPAVDAVGFLGEYFQLTLHYRQLSERSILNNAPMQPMQLKLFVKALPQQNTEKEKQAIFRKETQLYDTLLPAMAKLSALEWCPRVYYAREDLLVLHDLHQWGYETCRVQTAGLSAWQMQATLRSLAALHAASIAFEQRHALNIGVQYGPLLQEITVSPSVAWCRTGLRAVLAVARRHPKYQSAHMQDYVEYELPARLEQIFELVNPSEKYRNVLCHRDIWYGNIFFPAQERRKAGAAIFVDYQTCRYSPPSIDLLLTFFLNLETAERQRVESEYLTYYYRHFREALQQQGITAEEHVSEAELFNSYREFQLFGHLYKALAVTLLEVPKALVTNHYVHKNRAQSLLVYMESNAAFRTYMQACVENVIELVLQHEL